MKKPGRVCALLIVLLTLLALNSAFGQANRLEPKKFDEIGYLNHENYSAHLDAIAVALQQDPTVQGYFIFYNGPKSLPGAAFRYVKRLQNYMVGPRGIDPSRLILLEGGQRDGLTVEFWLAPPGGSTPVPDPAASVKLAAKSFLYDSYNFDCDPLFEPKGRAPYYSEDCGYSGMEYEDQSARLDGFIKAVSQTPGATARLVVYSRTRDARTKVLKFIQKERNYLVSKGGLNSSNIAVVSRKARQYRSVELWVVRPLPAGKISSIVERLRIFDLFPHNHSRRQERPDKMLV